MSDTSAATVTSDEVETHAVVVYSDDAAVRDQVRQALGRRPAPDLGRVEWVECSTGDEVLRAVDAGGVDLVVLDGEAWPTGGLGLAKQMKDELRDCPHVLVLIARRPDAWLATWSQADGVVAHPIDAPELTAVATDLLRARRSRLPVRRALHQETVLTTTWSALLARLLHGDDLSTADTAWAMGEVMSGAASPAQTAGFAVALRAKGETAEEVAGLVEVMLEEAAPLTVSGRVVDTCGTGGDRLNTVNLSTMAALVVAGAGVPVVKHGNRAASSACGSADLLEALGVVVDLPPAAVGPCLEQAGIAFCFAPVFHPGMRHAAVARRELGVPTVFNVLGPLTNPARPAAQAVGVSDRRLAPVMAGVLAARGADALVFRGDDGLDELTTTGPSTVWTVSGGAVVEQSFDPAELGVPRATLQQLRGADAAHNASVASALLDGRTGPVRDAVLLNAAAALAAHAAGTGPLVERLSQGWDRAAASLDGGAARDVLLSWVEVSTGLR